MAQEKNLQGIRGWLILVALGVIIAPIRIAILMATTYPELFSDGTWQAITDQAGQSYNPRLATLLIIEIVVNAAFIVAWLFAAYLMFTKKAFFPKWYIGLLLLSLVFIFLDTFFTTWAVPEVEMFDPDTVKEIAKTALDVVIWVPYMLVSKRVKATFVN